MDGGEKSSPFVFSVYIIMDINLFGRSHKWKKVRKEHLIHNPNCAACGRTDNLEVHHIEPYHINPDRELDPTNLITLCDNYCHFVFGHLMDYKSWNKNIVEDCKIYKEKRNSRPINYSFRQQKTGFIYEIFSIIYSNALRIFFLFNSRNNRS